MFYMIVSSTVASSDLRISRITFIMYCAIAATSWVLSKRTVREKWTSSASVSTFSSLLTKVREDFCAIIPLRGVVKEIAGGFYISNRGLNDAGHYRMQDRNPRRAAYPRRIPLCTVIDNECTERMSVRCCARRRVVYSFWACYHVSHISTSQQTARS